MTNQHPEFDAAPASNVARGFALYVGVDEETAKAAGTSLADLVTALRAKVTELVPAAHDETYAAVALAPKNIGGKNVDIVRTALRDPRALDKLVSKAEDDEAAANKEWGAIDKAIMDEAPVAVAFTPKQVDFLSKRVKNYNFSKQFYMLVSQLQVK